MYASGIQGLDRVDALAKVLINVEGLAVKPKSVMMIFWSMTSGQIKALTPECTTWEVSGKAKRYVCSGHISVDAMKW